VIQKYALGHGNYTPAWLARAVLLSKTRAFHARYFPIADIGVKALSQAGPDQNNWIERLSRVGGGSQRLTVLQLFRVCGYTGAPELFSMWACLCSSVRTSLVFGHEDALAAMCHEFYTGHGWLPHPAILVQGLLE
jgi:hypothetical protein